MTTSVSQGKRDVLDRIRKILSNNWLQRLLMINLQTNLIYVQAIVFIRPMVPFL